MFADLHLHTRYSDGTYTPVELAGSARRTGLSLISLTDHDTMEGCAEVAVEAARQGIGFIPGTEVTAEFEGREIHVLAYFVDPLHAGFSAELARAQEIRQTRVREMVARLNSRGVTLDVAAVFRLANCNAPGRPHVARALVEHGTCADLDEAFERYLKKDRPGWVPKRKMSVALALELIHAAGGLAVIAHPGLNHDDSLIGKLARLGLDGMECFHPKHSLLASRKYQAMAVELGLLVTGGSDCHGQSKNRPTMGTVRLAWEHVERLQSCWDKRRAPSSGAGLAGPTSLPVPTVPERRACP